MFVINIYLRFALITIFLGGGVVLAFLKGFGIWYALPLILIGLILLAGYFLLGTIMSTGELVQASKIEEAEKQLSLTIFPNLLYSANRSVYYIMKGTFALHHKDTDTAEDWLRKAREIKSPTDNEKAMIELQLASIAVSKNKMNQAQIHMRTIKELNITENAIKDQVKQFEKAMSQQGAQKSAMMMQGKKGGGMYFQPGGKRRRPKMR
jgi:hypothetical protein